MSSVVRVMQWVGIAVLVATAFHPVFHFRAYPVEGLDVPQQGVVTKTPSEADLDANQDYPKPDGSKRKKKK